MTHFTFKKKKKKNMKQRERRKLFHFIQLRYKTILGARRASGWSFHTWRNKMPILDFLFK